jgi:MFS superfamily sulfate permease-like transporter
VDRDEQETVAQIPGMLILRLYAPLVFLDARVLTRRMKAPALAREGLRVVVIDATASSGIDSTAADAFRKLVACDERRRRLADDGVEILPVPLLLRAPWEGRILG